MKGVKNTDLAQNKAASPESDGYRELKEQWGLSDEREREDELLLSFLPEGTDLASLTSGEGPENDPAIAEFKRAASRLTQAEIHEVNQIVSASLNFNFNITIH